MKIIKKITIREVLISILLFLCFSNLKVHAGFWDFDLFDIDWGSLFEWNWPWENEDLSPFDYPTWNKIIKWYAIFTVLAGVPIIIGVIITSYKFITAGTSISRRNDAKESFMRLFLGGVAIALAPVFVKLLLYINTSMVRILISGTNGGLNKLLGNRIFTQIRTGSTIATALVICLFAYLFIKFNIKFIIRKFTLIVFIVFTPLIAGMWIINKNVTGAAIWFG